MIFHSFLEYFSQIPSGDFIDAYLSPVFRLVLEVFLLTLNRGECPIVPYVYVWELRREHLALIIRKPSSSSLFRAGLIPPDSSHPWFTTAEFIQSQFFHLGDSHFVVLKSELSIHCQTRKGSHLIVGDELEIMEFPSPDVVVVIENIVLWWSKFEVRRMIEDIMFAEKHILPRGILKSGFNLIKVRRVAPLSPFKDDLFISKTCMAQGNAGNMNSSIGKILSYRVSDRISELVISIIYTTFQIRIMHNFIFLLLDHQLI